MSSVLSLRYAVDRSARLFASWRALPEYQSPDRAYALDRLEPAAREWLAVLARFADFDGRPPQVHISVYPSADGLVCCVSDNSDGAPCSRMPRPGNDDEDRQTAMLLIQALTDYAAYRRRSGANTMQFRVDFGVWATTPSSDVRSGARSLRELLIEQESLSHAA